MKVDIVAVTKNRNIDEIINLPAKIRIIGENKIQEAIPKIEKLLKMPSRKFEYHFIGNLQKNKIKKAVKYFKCIQSVNSLELLQKINTEAKNQNKKQEIFLQVNISDDSAKIGFTKNEVQGVCKGLQTYQNIQLTGLMTILKNNLTNKESLKYYQTMNILFNNLNKTILKKTPLKYLSMGMSDDWEEAIKGGSNMIRIGRALFDTNNEKNFLNLI